MGVNGDKMATNCDKIAAPKVFPMIVNINFKKVFVESIVNTQL